MARFSDRFDHTDSTKTAPTTATSVPGNTAPSSWVPTPSSPRECPTDLNCFHTCHSGADHDFSDHGSANYNSANYNYNHNATSSCIGRYIIVRMPISSTWPRPSSFR
jgi:hypothetical protein